MQEARPFKRKAQIYVGEAPSKRGKTIDAAIAKSASMNKSVKPSKRKKTNAKESQHLSDEVSNDLSHQAAAEEVLSPFHPDAKPEQSLKRYSATRKAGKIPCPTEEMNAYTGNCYCIRLPNFAEGQPCVEYSASEDCEQWNRLLFWHVFSV